MALADNLAALLEPALLIITGGIIGTLVVDVSPETQLKRTMQRDDVTREHVEQILAAQATREARLAVADDVIDNNGAPDAIASDVARLHAHYLQLASQFVSQEKP